MSSLIEFAEGELRALPGRRDSDRIMLERDVVALAALFDAQRHSGASARFVVNALVRLLRWQKLDAAENDPAPTDAAEIAEVVARVRGRSLAVCDNCGGQGYTDMGKSACAGCFGAGVITQEMAYALGVADRAEAAASAEAPAPSARPAPLAREG